MKTHNKNFYIKEYFLEMKMFKETTNLTDFFHKTCYQLQFSPIHQLA